MDRMAELWQSCAYPEFGTQTDHTTPNVRPGLWVVSQDRGQTPVRYLL